jgi:hypothetical protein
VMISSDADDDFRRLATQTVRVDHNQTNPMRPNRQTWIDDELGRRHLDGAIGLEAHDAIE